VEEPRDRNSKARFGVDSGLRRGYGCERDASMQVVGSEESTRGLPGWSRCLRGLSRHGAPSNISRARVATSSDAGRERARGAP